MFHVTDLKTIFRLFRIYIVAQVNVVLCGNLTVSGSPDTSVQTPGALTCAACAEMTPHNSGPFPTGSSSGPAFVSYTWQTV